MLVLGALLIDRSSSSFIANVTSNPDSQMDDNKIHHRYHQATNLVVVFDLKTIFAVFVAVMHLCLLLESTVDIHSIGILWFFILFWIFYVVRHCFYSRQRVPRRFFSLFSIQCVSTKMCSYEVITRWTRTVCLLLLFRHFEVLLIITVWLYFTATSATWSARRSCSKNEFRDIKAWW